MSECKIKECSFNEHGDCSMFKDMNFCRDYRYYEQGRADAIDEFDNSGDFTIIRSDEYGEYEPTQYTLQEVMKELRSKNE